MVIAHSGVQSEQVLKLSYQAAVASEAEGNLLVLPYSLEAQDLAASLRAVLANESKSNNLRSLLDKLDDAQLLATFPIALQNAGRTAQEARTVLGMGDVILPGLFTATMLRLDLDNFLKRSSWSPEFSAFRLFDKAYFLAGMAGYLVGLTL